MLRDATRGEVARLFYDARWARQRPFVTEQRVEQGGLPNVRAPYNRDVNGPRCLHLVSKVEGILRNVGRQARVQLQATSTSTQYAST